MELRALIAAAIFVGSYLPLSAILLVQDLKVDLLNRPFCSTLWSAPLNCELPLSNPGYSIGFVVFCLLCFSITPLVMSSGQIPQRISIKESKQIPTDLINYVVPYVVSFMSIEYGQLNKVLGFILFMVWIFWLSYKTGQVILNPILVIKGWKLYEIKYTYQNSTTERVDKAFGRTEFVPQTDVDVEFVQEIIMKKD